MGIAARSTDPFTAIVDDLTYSYDGVFAPQSVAAAVEAARRSLEPTSTVRTHLPVLVYAAATLARRRTLVVLIFRRNLPLIVLTILPFVSRMCSGTGAPKLKTSEASNECERSLPSSSRVRNPRASNSGFQAPRSAT